ncbi:hypothetical protein LVB87_12725 [Lysobacter sp. KIS68-7]|uniref:hypothetical protein n=1 Tax=Lysobacter sp. KIS68-7 TaxID=2904252 RepID=UPI001E36129C|nr:hypothetical protein [Lysobacter sp. KIS68-7]UHQ19038.1 hypothetical protein LVB87_12725 [Lysobacter sp. KIS68-7]
MIDGTALALVAGAIALYVYDASLMLFRDEVVFTHGARGWRATLGSGLVLGGRYLVVPGAWAPGRPIFRAGWSDTVPRDRPRAPMRAVLQALRPLQWASRTLAVLLFVGMPLGLFLQVGPRWMLALLVGLYGIAAACVAWTWRCRRVFGLDRKAFAALAFDVLACPPFAINIVMKLTLHIGLPNPPGDFARRLLPATDCAALLQAAHARMYPDASNEETLR